VFLQRYIVLRASLPACLSSSHVSSLHVLQFLYKIPIKIVNWKILVYYLKQWSQLVCLRGPVNVRRYYRGPLNGRRKFIPPSKIEGVYVFTTMLSSDTATDVSSNKNIPCADRCQLSYGQAPCRSPLDGEHRPKELISTLISNKQMP